MDPSPLRSRLRGVAAVAVTPFTTSLELDEPALRRIVRHLEDGGVDTVVACGGTGEYYALSPDERRRATEIVLDEARDVPVVASVGLGAHEAAAAVRHAADHGASGIMVHQPVHPYVHPDGLLAYYRRICDAAPLGVVAYVRDPLFSSDVLAAMGRIPNLVGVKYAINDLRRFGTTVQEVGQVADLEWICGTAEAWAPAYWLAGAGGFTSGLANFAPAESTSLRDALRQGDAGVIRERWRRLLPFEELRSRHRDGNNIAALKAAAHLCGLAGPAVRPPLRELPTEEVEELRTLIDGWDTSTRLMAGAGASR